MKRIEVSAEEFYSRAKQVSRFLGPLVSRREDLYVTYVSDKNESIITVIGKGFPQTGSYAGFRFNTIADGFIAMYHERWERAYENGKQLYSLERAYLHLYQINKADSSEIEFLLLHCDPNEPDNAAHAEYKQCLHLHIESRTAPWPHDIWPKAHIALNVGYRQQVLRDLRSLTDSIRVAVVMLKKQVLEQLL